MSFAFAVDEQGKRYVTMTHDETTKNHPGGLQDRSSFEKTAGMYETESETDGYRALSLYLQVESEMRSSISTMLCMAQSIVGTH